MALLPNQRGLGDKRIGAAAPHLPRGAPISVSQERMITFAAYRGRPVLAAFQRGTSAATITSCPALSARNACTVSRNVEGLAARQTGMRASTRVSDETGGCHGKPDG